MLKSDIFKIVVIIFIVNIAPYYGNTILVGLQIIIFLASFYIIINKQILYTIYPLFLPVIIGIINGLMEKHSSYDTFKDAYYFLNPICYIITGAMMAKKFPATNFLLGIVIAGSLFSSYQLFSSIKDFGLSGFIDPRVARESSFDTFAVGYVISSVSTIILICSRLYHLDIFKKKAFWTLLILNLMAVYLSASRTNLLVLLTGVTLMTYFKFRRHRYIIFTCFIFFLLGVTFFIMGNKKNHTLETIAKAPDEIAIRPAQNAFELNEHFRGHEAYVTLRSFNRGTPIQIAIGHGFGATVDLSRISPLGGRHIPIMHNGYPYILLKTGWIGMFIFIWFALAIIYLSLKHVSPLCKIDNRRFFCKYMTISIIPCIYITNIFFYGIFHPQYISLWILCGATLQYGLTRKKTAPK